MTREDAISALKTLRDVRLQGVEWTESLDMAIEALQADTVSREAHYDAVANRITDMEERGFVSVVRCKDCRHYESDGGALMVCSITDIVTDDDDFCSHGEGREDEHKV